MVLHNVIVIDNTLCSADGALYYEKHIRCHEDTVSHLIGFYLLKFTMEDFDKHPLYILTVEEYEEIRDAQTGGYYCEKHDDIFRRSMEKAHKMVKDKAYASNKEETNKVTVSKE